MFLILTRDVTTIRSLIPTVQLCIVFFSGLDEHTVVFAWVQGYRKSYTIKKSAVNAISFLPTTVYRGKRRLSSNNFNLKLSLVLYCYLISRKPTDFAGDNGSTLVFVVSWQPNGPMLLV